MADENEQVVNPNDDPNEQNIDDVSYPVQSTEYDWEEVTDISVEALTGAVVGLQVGESDHDMTLTGVLRLNGPNYEVTIDGHFMRIAPDGTIVMCSPAMDGVTVGTTKIQKVTAEMKEDTAVGGSITRAADTEQGYNQTAVLTSMEPRDHFAMEIMSAMLVHSDHPEGFDDAKWLHFARAAYKGAQAMMIAAADSRHGQSTDPNPPAVSVNPDDLQNNTEKLLYNMVDYMKKGITIKGTTEAGTVPVQTKVTEMPAVAVKNALDGNDDPIPLTTDINSMTAVEVKNPLDINDEAIPLEVNTHEVQQQA